MFLFVIDRFEGAYAVLESQADFSMSRVLRQELPDSVREGDCLVKAGEFFTIDPAETQKRRDYNKSLIDKLKNK